MRSKLILGLLSLFMVFSMTSCGYERVDAGCEGIKENFQLEQLTSGLKYPNSIVEAVNAKNAAIQKAQKAQNELAVVKAEAEKKVVAAQAEAEANKLRTQALTPMILKQQWIDKWDGKLPVYGSLPTLFKGIE